MARLKIGSGIQLEAQLPKLDPIPKIGPTAIENKPMIDIEELVKNAIAQLPQPEVAEKVDLSNLCTKNEMAVAVVKLCKQRDELESKVNELAVKLDELAHDTDFVIPEIKHITHVKDVSSEVLEKCTEMINSSKESLTNKLNLLEKRVKVEEKIRYILFGLLILTNFFHLL
jgi:uncharacterized coiled-coil DUF342 family protein